MVTEYHNKSLHQLIQEFAYQMWQSQGCPVGRDLDIWLEAETELASCDYDYDAECDDRNDEH